MRLSPAESAALSTALAAAGFPADDPLADRLLTAAAASFDAETLERTLRSTIATHDSTIFETLASAVARAATCSTIAYQNDAATEATSRASRAPAALRRARCVVPLGVVPERGRDADISRRPHPLRRQDRGAVRACGGERDASAPTAFAPEGLPVARLRFAPGEAFVEREWPGGRVVSTEADGSTLAEVPFAGTGWIARRVVARLGRVEAVAPAEVRDAVRALAHEELARL